VAVSFFQLLKRERIKRKIYEDFEAARQDIFNYVGMFYNPVHRHGFNNDPSPVEFERQYAMKQTGVWDSGGDSTLCRGKYSYASKNN
jgi:putative transposase